MLWPEVVNIRACTGAYDTRRRNNNLDALSDGFGAHHSREANDNEGPKSATEDYTYDSPLSRHETTTIIQKDGSARLIVSCADG